MTTKTGAKRGSKAGVKRGSYKKRAKAEGSKAEGGEQEPLEKFRKRGTDANPEKETTDEDPVGDKVQKRLPGQGRPYSKKLEKQALKLYATQSERLSVAAREKEEREELQKIMVDEGIDEYPLPGDLIAELSKEETVKALVHKV